MRQELPEAKAEPMELEEHRAVLSLLRCAEFVSARGCLEDSVRFALLLCGFGIKDPETLKVPGMRSYRFPMEIRWKCREIVLKTYGNPMES